MSQTNGSQYQMGGKFYTTVSRYVHGKCIAATPEYPALIEFEPEIKIKLGADGKPEDRTLIPYAEEKPEPPPAQKLKPAYADVRRGPPGRAPVVVKNGQRPSDVDPS